MSPGDALENTFFLSKTAKVCLSFQKIPREIPLGSGLQKILP